MRLWVEGKVSDESWCQFVQSVWLVTLIKISSYFYGFSINAFTQFVNIYYGQPSTHLIQYNTFSLLLFVYIINAI